MGIFNEEQRAQLFQDEDKQSDVWIGKPMSAYPRHEFMPFKFASVRYIMMMGHPAFEVGGDDMLPVMSEQWANGFTPAEHSRIMKFQVADAEQNQFLPKKEWKLPNPRYIFQFSEVLRDVVTLHLGHFPEMTQYFYWPASPQLTKLYTRIFSRAPDDCPIRQFEPILDPLGEYFYGYQRKEVGK